MFLNSLYNRVFTSLLLLLPICVTADDIPGGKDFPDLPRVEGTEIIAQDRADYDLGLYIDSVADQEMNLVEPEGVRTRIVYLGREGQTPLLMQKNYQAALSNLGEVEPLFNCRASACPRKLPSTLWNRSNWVPSEALTNPQYIYNQSSNFRTPTYWYGKVTKGSRQLHVSVFSAMITEKSPNAIARNRTLVHLQIIEVADFAPTLEFVSAAEMQSKIATEGHIALYGVLFDHDSALLKPASDPTIAEIAKALAKDQALKLYVVGHTDGKGALDYNRDLSGRRAASVVAALSERHGISSLRLTPVGIGPVAPVATNDTEQGRELNRRVELVAIAG